MDAVIDQLVQLAGAVLAPLLVAVVVQVLRRIGLSVDAERKAMLEYFAKQAVLGVEERAAAWAKANISGRAMSGAEKMQAALEEVLARVPRVSREEAKAVIEAVLPQLHIGAAAGARELGKALRTKE